MNDGRDSLVQRFMRQLDVKLDRVIDDLGDIKVRMKIWLPSVAGWTCAWSGSSAASI